MEEKITALSSRDLSSDLPHVATTTTAATIGVGANNSVDQSLHHALVDINWISGSSNFRDFFKKDCTDLGRQISLLSHLVDEIGDCKLDLLDEDGSSSASSV